MKEEVRVIVKDYLNYFDEGDKLKDLEDFIYNNKEEDIKDWNNFKGHLVAGGFVFAREEKKFLLLYHKDLEMFLYPGGHMDKDDGSPYDTAVREVKEETGFNDIVIWKNGDVVIPFDIDIHITKEVKAKKLPSHKHYDFRYLFIIPKIEEVKLDKSEHDDYKWVDIEEIAMIEKYEKVADKLRIILGLNE